MAFHWTSINRAESSRSKQRALFVIDLWLLTLRTDNYFEALYCKMKGYFFVTGQFPTDPEVQPKESKSPRRRTSRKSDPNNTSLTSSDRSLSKFTIPEIEKEFDVSLEKLMHEEHVLVDRLLTLRTDNLNNYFEAIYCDMKGYFLTYGQFPTDLEKENTRSPYLEKFVGAAVKFVKTNYMWSLK